MTRIKIFVIIPHNRLKANNISIEDFRTFEKHYGDGVTFAMNNLKFRKGSCHISILAAVAKAFYSLNKYGVGVDRLERFCEIFVSGRYDAANAYEDTALVCRNNFFEISTEKKKADKKIDLYAVPVYAKAAYYIDAFLDGRVIGEKNTSRAQSDPFVLTVKPLTSIVKDDKDLESIVGYSVRDMVCAKGVVEA